MANNRLSIYVKMDPFLKAFCISIFGEEPIFIPRNNDGIYIGIFEKYLVKPTIHDIISIPEDRSNILEITLPYYPNTNINVKNFLSANSQAIIKQRVADLFWEDYYRYMTESYKDNIPISNAIMFFIEKHNLPYKGKIDEMLRKSLYRRKKLIFQRPKRQYIKKS
jgi:hypothetical protein